MKDKKKRDEILREIEELAKQADKESDLSLGFQIETEEEEFSFDSTFLNDTQDPKKSHRIFYSMQGLINANLPSGKEYKKLRKFVNEEKLIFLNQGAKLKADGTRGSDSRQSYTALLEIALNTVIEWIKSGANAFELYLRFRELNIAYGFHQDEPES